MEQESFENNTIAELLNREYICVKVDREERPDVDAVYMSVCQAMNGQGGWPLTIIMTPACRPFFSGTYLPPKARYGRVGLEELLTAVAGQWKTNRGKLLDSAGRIEAYLKEQERATVSAEPGMDLVHQAFRQFAGNFDKKNGGFGGAPKFPTPHNLMFLMEYGIRGLLLGSACFVPQCFFYIPATLSFFFIVYQMSQKFWKRQSIGRKRYQSYIFFLMAIGIVYLCGIFMESYVNYKVLVYVKTLL